MKYHQFYSSLLLLAVLDQACVLVHTAVSAECGKASGCLELIWAFQH